MCTETAEQTRLPLSACGGELFLFSDERIRIDLDHYHSHTLADICPSNRPDRLHGAAAAAGLPHRRAPGDGRGPAEEPGEVGDGGVVSI
jgi:hypothetical protein